MMTAATCVFRSRVPLTEFSVFRTIRDVTTSAVLSSLRDFATRPKSIVKGETHVNKTAVSLYQRMKENAHGIRDVYAEQLQQVRMEAIREEDEGSGCFPSGTRPAREDVPSRLHHYAGERARLHAEEDQA